MNIFAGGPFYWIDHKPQNITAIEKSTRGQSTMHEVKMFTDRLHNWFQNNKTQHGRRICHENIRPSGILQTRYMMPRQVLWKVKANLKLPTLIPKRREFNEANLAADCLKTVT